MNDKILRCLQCNDLFRPTRYDLNATFCFDREMDAVTEIEVNDSDNFIMTHRGHDIIELHILNDSFCSHYPYSEPIREDYLQATDGIETYTIRRWREHIGMPLEYEIADVRIRRGEPIYRVQTAELKEQMTADDDMLELGEEKISKFVNSCESFVSDIRQEDIVECGVSTDEPMISYARLHHGTMEKFLAEHCLDFTDEELKRLRVFAEANSEYNDVMNIQVIYSFQLCTVEYQMADTALTKLG